MSKHKVEAASEQEPTEAAEAAAQDAQEGEQVDAKVWWKRRSWKEMSAAQKAGNIVLAVIEVVLTAWALLDIKNRPQEQIKGKKLTWVMTAFIQPFGPVIYFLFGRKKEGLSQPLPA